MYNDNVLDHFANPRNVGSITDADGIGNAGNPIDGDKITIDIKVHNKTLVDVRFKTFGCGAAIAASSMLTVLAIGKSLEEGLKITNDDVANALGGLPPEKLLCSNIAADALHAAINAYLSKNKSNSSASENVAEKALENFSGPKEIDHEAMNKDQIKRYLRHIIMPKISGPGQKKLLDTRVLICAQTVAACDVLLNYMVASGIGQIYCLLDLKDGWDNLFAHVHDLNPEINIELVEAINADVDFNIIIGNFDFATRISDALIQTVPPEFSPTLIAVTYAWQGYVNCCSDAKSVKNFLAAVSQKYIFVKKIPNQEYFQQTGLSMSTAFLGTLLAIELIKARLNIGKPLNESFYFNLWEMSFINNFSMSKGNFQNSQFFVKHLKKTLAQAKVLIVGTGGLGCPTALSLARAGVGTIGLVDYDHVEISNLNRQILHTTSKIGLPKVESAKQRLKQVNPKMTVNLYPVAFSTENALEITNDYDIIIDGLDNLPTRYLLNDTCFFEKKPLVEAGALAFYGQVTTIVSGDGPCYRCIFPESTTSSPAQSCSETGVLGPVPGLMGVLQAVEALKIAMGFNSRLKGELLMYDALETDLEIAKFRKNSDCQLCGDHPRILDLGDYRFACEDKKDK
ncbi:MAG: ThiF family adenylyltransferase [Acetobacterium sp.]